MSEQFRLIFKTDAEAAQAEKCLEGLMMNGRRVMFVKLADHNEVFAGCTIGDRVPDDAIVTNSKGVTRKFHDLFYDCNLIKSGMHHRDGIFWISTPERAHTVQTERVPLRVVAPTILALMGYDAPAYMELPAMDVAAVHAAAV